VFSPGENTPSNKKIDGHLFERKFDNQGWLTIQTLVSWLNNKKLKRGLAHYSDIQCVPAGVAHYSTPGRRKTLAH